MSEEKVSRKQENTKTPRDVLDRQQEYVDAEYKQIKLAIPKDEAEAFQSYCKSNGLKVASLLRILMKEEIQSSQEFGVGKGAEKLVKYGLVRHKRKINDTEETFAMKETFENENVKRFEALMSEVKRDGIDGLMNFIRKSDFYTAPASTRFHLSEEGGLLQHSLHVYECLNAKKDAPLWKDILKNVSRETILLVSLLHDICKTYYYVPDFKNQKTYEEDKVKFANPSQVKHDAKGDFIWETVPCYTVDNKYPLGHGSKSVVFILQYMKLSMEEITAITYHMGAYCDSSQWNELGQAYEKYPLALALHQADMEATHLLEVEKK